jgi:AcrR family transcriptional regulator
MREIKEIARRILLEQGAEGLSLRGIAREMGVTAPALYRYFPDRKNLLENLIADLYGELCASMLAARDTQPPDRPDLGLIAVSRAFRDWAIRHRPEFALLFGSPIGEFNPSSALDVDTWQAGPAYAAGRRFGGIFAKLVAQLYATRPFPAPTDDEIDPRLRSQLSGWSEPLFQASMPLGVLQVFLSCWIRLYGAVSMEVFGHLGFALSDVEPMFEVELRGLAEVLGVAEAYRRRE